MAGTPADIADQMEAWYKAGAADGFNLMFPLLDEFLQAGRAGAAAQGIDAHGISKRITIICWVGSVRGGGRSSAQVPADRTGPDLLLPACLAAAGSSRRRRCVEKWGSAFGRA